MVTTPLPHFSPQSFSLLPLGPLAWALAGWRQTMESQSWGPVGPNSTLRAALLPRCVPPLA